MPEQRSMQTGQQMTRQGKNLSQHPCKGYRLQIGNYFTPEGKKTGKVWWFGRVDFHQAEFQVGLIRHIFHDRCPDGLWTPDATEFAKTVIARDRIRYEGRLRSATNLLEGAGMVVRPGPHPEPAARKARTLTPMTSGEPMLYQSLDAYVAAIKGKAISPAYARRIAETVGDLKVFREDCPLSKVDRLWLERLTDEFKGRPLRRTKNRSTGKREPIRPATVKTYLQHWRQMFDWIDQAADSDRFGEWEAPRRWQDLFACDMKKLMTKTERDKAADGPDQLTIEEIKALLIAADNRQRMLILLALFAGLGQTELSVTRRDEFDLEGSRFTHRRNKTGQRGEYWLPPELVQLLRNHFHEVKAVEGNLAFYTREGLPLVTRNSDSVRQFFEDLRKKAGVTRPHMTFYAFRRFLGDRAKRRGGTELRDAALAHAGNTVGDRHYSNFRAFGKVEELAREIRDELLGAGALGWSESVKPASASNAGANSRLGDVMIATA